ncbi:Polysaccharide deacetylase domain-containing protein [Dictyocoela muelleri]|nr:Polysaccharide deacetylase domain-containing protein [Dictyocoela muelleri]
MLLSILFSLCSLPTKCTKAGTIAITFDDGPTEYGTPEIFDICNDLGVLVSFHFVTTSISRDAIASIMRQASDNGHQVGLRVNPQRDYDTMSSDEIKTDINNQLSVLSDEISKKVKFARAPVCDGTANQDIYSALTEDDVIQTSYNFCIYDEVSNPQEITKKLDKLFLSSNVSRDSFIFLLHDAREEDFPTLRKIVEIGKSYGYKFVTLDECLDGYKPGDTLITSGSSNLKNSSHCKRNNILPLCMLLMLLM